MDKYSETIHLHRWRMIPGARAWSAPAVGQLSGSGGGRSSGSTLPRRSVDWINGDDCGEVRVRILSYRCRAASVRLEGVGGEEGAVVQLGDRGTASGVDDAGGQRGSGGRR
jgi:hypothetical protein